VSELVATRIREHAERLRLAWLADNLDALVTRAEQAQMGYLEFVDLALEEEVGLRGGTWTEFGVFYTTPGFCRERTHLFVAHGVERGRSSPEADEELEVVRWPMNEIAARLYEIEDAKTLAGLLLYLHETQLRTSP